MFRVGWVVAALLLSVTGRAQPPPTDSPPTDSPPTDSPPTDSPPTDSPPTDSYSAPERAKRETNIALLVGLGRRPTTEDAAWGLAYGLDVQLQWWRRVTLDVGCDQFVSGQGLADTRVRVWSTACGAAAGLGHGARRYFVGAALGADAVVSAQSIRFGDAADRSWAVFGLARIQAHGYYVYRRVRFGATVKVRLGRFARRDTRLLLSIGWIL